jgi:hypothetical protein
MAQRMGAIAPEQTWLTGDESLGPKPLCKTTINGLHSFGSSDVTPRQRGMTVVRPSSSIISQRRPLLSSK